MIAGIWYANALLTVALIMQILTFVIKRDTSLWRAIDFASMVMIIASVYYILALLMRP